MVVTPSGRAKSRLAQRIKRQSPANSTQVAVRLTDVTPIDFRLTDEWPTEAHIRHLEMIQSIVARMATNSFLAKGWALTIAVAAYGFAVSHLNPWICLAGILSSLGFWWLDAYYLRAERSFRCLYNAACKPGTAVEIFSLNVGDYKKDQNLAWGRVFFSATLFIFYGMLLIVGVGFVIASVTHSTSSTTVKIESHSIL